jgi:hypothetical protein
VTDSSRRQIYGREALDGRPNGGDCPGTCLGPSSCLPREFERPIVLVMKRGGGGKGGEGGWLKERKHGGTGRAREEERKRMGGGRMRAEIREAAWSGKAAHLQRMVQPFLQTRRTRRAIEQGQRYRTMCCKANDGDRLLLDHGRLERGDDGLVKDVLEALLRQGRALDVLDGAELTREPLARVVLDGPLLLPGELLADGGVLSQVDLGADNQAGHARAVVVDLGEPFLLDVLERCRARDREADEEDVGLRVRERTQTVVILLACKAVASGVR